MCRRLANFASSAQSHDLSHVHTMRASVCRFGRNWKDIVSFVGTRSVSQVSQWVKFRTFNICWRDFHEQYLFALVLDPQNKQLDYL